MEKYLPLRRMVLAAARNFTSPLVKLTSNTHTAAIVTVAIALVLFKNFLSIESIVRQYTSVLRPQNDCMLVVAVVVCRFSTTSRWMVA